MVILLEKYGNLDWLNYGHAGDEDYGKGGLIRSFQVLISGLTAGKESLF